MSGKRRKPNVDRAGEDEVFLGEDGKAVDLSTNKGVKQQQQKAELHDLSKEDMLLAVMSTKEGRALIWTWLIEAAIFEEPFMGTGFAEDTAYACGEKAWGRKLYAECQTPRLLALYRQMQDEAMANGGTQLD